MPPQTSSNSDGSLERSHFLDEREKGETPLDDLRQKQESIGKKVDRQPKLGTKARETRQLDKFSQRIKSSESRTINRKEISAGKDYLSSETKTPTQEELGAKKGEKKVSGKADKKKEKSIGKMVSFLLILGLGGGTYYLSKEKTEETAKLTSSFFYLGNQLGLLKSEPRDKEMTLDGNLEGIGSQREGFQSSVKGPQKIIQRPESIPSKQINSPLMPVSSALGQKKQPVSAKDTLQAEPAAEASDNEIVNGPHGDIVGAELSGGLSPVLEEAEEGSIEGSVEVVKKRGKDRITEVLSLQENSKEDIEKVSEPGGVEDNDEALVAGSTSFDGRLEKQVVVASKVEAGGKVTDEARYTFATKGYDRRALKEREELDPGAKAYVDFVESLGKRFFDAVVMGKELSKEMLKKLLN